MHMTRSHLDKNFILGIDVGTSGCKVLLADKAGTVRASAVEPYPLTQPRPGWTEQDPRLWWNACCAACRRVLNAGVCDGSDIAAVGLTGQMHSLVALDERMDPIRPAILWNDQRTTAQCREIQELSGGLDGLLNYTNNMMLTGYTGGKILWLRDEEPEHFRKMVRFICPKDYIRFKITGIADMDVADAQGLPAVPADRGADDRRIRRLRHRAFRCTVPPLGDRVAGQAGPAGVDISTGM